MGRAGLALLGDDLATGEPQRVLRVELHQHVDLFAADAHRAFADVEPTAVLGAAQHAEFLGADLLDEQTGPVGGAGQWSALG